jgi:6-phosphofructokinase 1
MELPLSVVLVLPELPFDSASVVTAVDRQLASHGYCTVVLSEGCKDAQGEYLARQGVADALGHVHLGGAAPRLARTIAQRLAVKVHWAVADYLQRSARHLASAVDVAQAEAVGIHAVRLALAGADARMPVIVRLADDPYRWELGDVALEAVVAAGERRLPAEFLGSTPFTVSEACTRYLAPLIAGEASPPFANGLPCYRLLRAVPVPRRLPPLARSV